ncbi:SDR family oxidoreductase [candidate division KSB1 bacterium]|nr:SDR family oxidoreductase [candidate division KSB1 bacterium]RQW00153.1 MAG: SDR family oxidoreductase [candidate division KSB1 bacterium]
MILVVGATGMVGGEICRLLAIDGQPVHALVRKSSDAHKVQHLHDIGIPTVEGDVREKSSLAQAMEYVTEVIATVSAMPFSYIAGENDIDAVDCHGMINLIDAAKEAHARKFIYTSFSGHLDIECPLRNAKRTVEKYLQESGLHYTILRPSCFMEVWLSPAVGFDTEHGQAQIYGSGENPISYISYKDVARFAVESLHNPAATDKILELGGPQALSQLEAVKIFESALGRKMKITHVTKQTLEHQRDEASDPMQESFSSLMLCVANGDPIDMTPIRNDFPFHLTSVKEYAQHMPH